MILVDEDAVLVEHRRAGAAVIVAEIAELAMPHQRAIEIEGGETVRAKRRIDALPVGHRRRRRVAVLAVGALDPARRHVFLPQQRAVRAPEREHRDLRAAVARGRDEEVILPDDRRGMASAGDLNLPSDVLRVGPGVHVVRPGDVPLSRRSTPARPVGGALSFDGDQRDRRRSRGHVQGDGSQHAQDLQHGAIIASVAP